MDPQTQKSNWKPLVMILALSGFFFLLFSVVSIGLFKSAMKSETSNFSFSTKTSAKEYVGVIDVNGVIMSSERFIEKLDELNKNDKVKAIVVHVDSPGGAVAPSQEMYEAIKASKKPVTISMSNVAASGGFYLAMAGKKIFANPGTITGSIGVIMEFANLEKLYDWAKIKRYSIKTGAYKDAGAEYREMKPDERKLFQDMIDNVLSQFKKAIVEGRNKKPEEIDAISDGRVFSGEQALALGLVDKLGTFKQAVEFAAKEAGMKEHEIYKPERRKKWIEQILEGIEQDQSSEEAHSKVSDVLASALRKSMGLGAAVALKPGLYWIWKGL